MSNQMRRVLVKLKGRSAGLVTLVIDRLANTEITVRRILDDHGVDNEFKILSEDY